MVSQLDFFNTTAIRKFIELLGAYVTLITLIFIFLARLILAYYFFQFIFYSGSLYNYVAQLLTVRHNIAVQLIELLWGHNKLYYSTFNYITVAELEQKLQQKKIDHFKPCYVYTVQLPVSDLLNLVNVKTKTLNANAIDFLCEGALKDVHKGFFLKSLCIKDKSDSLNYVLSEHFNKKHAFSLVRCAKTWYNTVKTQILRTLKLSPPVITAFDQTCFVNVKYWFNAMFKQELHSEYYLEKYFLLKGFDSLEIEAILKNSMRVCSNVLGIVCRDAFNLNCLTDQTKPFYTSAEGESGVSIESILRSPSMHASSTLEKINVVFDTDFNLLSWQYS